MADYIYHTSIPAALETLSDFVYSFKEKKIQIRDANEEKNSKDKWYDDKKKSWEIFMVLPKNFLGKKRVSREDFVSFLAFFLTAIGDDYLIFRTTT